MLSLLRQDTATHVAGVPRDITTMIDQLARPVHGELVKGIKQPKKIVGWHLDGTPAEMSIDQDWYWPLEEDCLIILNRRLVRPATGEQWRIYLRHDKVPQLIRDNQYVPHSPEMSPRCFTVELSGKVWVLLQSQVYFFHVNDPNNLIRVILPVEFLVNHILSWKHILYVQEKNTGNIWRWNQLTNEMTCRNIGPFDQLAVDPATGIVYSSYRRTVFSEEGREVLTFSQEITGLSITPQGQVLINHQYLYG